MSSTLMAIIYIISLVFNLILNICMLCQCKSLVEHSVKYSADTIRYMRED